MAQDLTVNVKTTSDVPQAMDKAKQATTGFGKQVEDIGKKFSTSFKDIFLSFLGPMALLTAAISIIGKMIADNAKKREEANQAAIDGTNELMSAEDRYYAKKRDNEKKDKENKEQAAMSREEITKDFLLNDPIGRAYLYTKQGGKAQEQLPSWLKGLQKLTGSDDSAAGMLSKSQEAQMFVQTALMSQRRENPLPNDKDKTFKGPEGFGNVIGVGPNPVLEAMAQQTEIALAQLAELQKISGSTPAGQGDFTKGTQSK
jgi:hypothetical protein